VRERLILGTSPEKRLGVEAAAQPIKEGERMPVGRRVLDYRASDASSRIHRN
jgi:hypothetical protein